ncbi:MAG TPA: hypothetical protein VKA15_08695, partial [Isosphaeraceae bacterium]|nr:hypothetical protein [Isosphaeraceae bacterium]
GAAAAAGKDQEKRDECKPLTTEEAAWLEHVPDLPMERPRESDRHSRGEKPELPGDWTHHRFLH